MIDPETSKNVSKVLKEIRDKRLALDALIHIRDNKGPWCRNECTPCLPECVARHVLDVLKNSGEK